MLPHFPYFPDELRSLLHYLQSACNEHEDSAQRIERYLHALGARPEIQYLHNADAYGDARNAWLRANAESADARMRLTAFARQLEQQIEELEHLLNP